MREPNLDIEIDDNKKAILVVECQDCRDKSRFLLNEVSPGTSVLCNCGGVLSITENSLKSIHQKLDDIKNTL